MLAVIFVSSLLVTSFTVLQARLMFDELDLSDSLSHHYSKLMDNQHIVMIGDSLMRYQYLSLVYLINTNTFYPADKKPSILWEGDHAGWNAFFNATNWALYPNEFCDCYRLGFINENRYYFHKERNITISYLAYFGDNPEQKLHGHWGPHDNETNHQFRAPNIKEFIPYRWEYNTISEALSAHAAQLKPKPGVLILNAGFWGNKYYIKEHRDSVLNLAVSLFDRVIWKTTNYNRDNQLLVPYDGICDHPGVECLNLEWTKYLQPEDFTDNKHFAVHIYADIDIQLITQLARKNTTLSFVPLSSEFYGTVVQHNGKSYYVDGQGLLSFLPPTKDAMNKECWQTLQNRPHVHLPGPILRNHLLGRKITNVCTTQKSQKNPAVKGRLAAKS